MLIDARGLKHPEPLQKLREAVSSICSIGGYIDVLVDDENALKHLRTYAAMSGCKYEVTRMEAYCSIRIEGTCV